MIKVSRILKAMCNRRAWVSPTGIVTEFPASVEHADYAPTILRNNGMGNKVVEYLGKVQVFAALDYLRNQGWIQLGKWGGGHYGLIAVVGNSCNDVQLHAIQNIASDAEWRCPTINFDAGFYTELPTDDFVTVNKVSDLRRLREPVPK